MADQSNQRAVSAVDRARKAARRARASDVAQFAIGASRMRNDTKLQDALANADNQHIEPWVHAVTFNLGVDAAGTVIVNKAIEETANEGSDGVKRMLGAALYIWGAPGATNLNIDTFAFLGSGFELQRNVGRPVEIETAMIMNDAFSVRELPTTAAIVSQIEGGTPRAWTTDKSVPFAIIIPGDKWSLNLVNVSGGAITADAKATLVIFGDKLITD